MDIWVVIEEPFEHVYHSDTDTCHGCFSSYRNARKYVLKYREEHYCFEDFSITGDSINTSIIIEGITKFNIFKYALDGGLENL